MCRWRVLGLARGRLVMPACGRLRHASSTSLPFNTLTKVYGEMMHPRPSRQEGGARVAEGSGLPDLGVWSNETEVTNHVGELGVMSARARTLREQDASQPSTHATEQGKHRPTPSVISRQPFLQRPTAPAASPPTTESAGTKGTRIAFAKPSGDAAESGALERLKLAHRAQRKQVAASASSSSEASPVTAGPAAGLTKSGRTRHSGVQMEILTVYRQMLRAVNKMHDHATRANLRSYIRAEFDEHVGIPRRSITKVEWHIHHAKRKLEDLQAMSPRTKFSIKRK